MKKSNIIQDLLDNQSFIDWAASAYDADHNFCQTLEFKQIDAETLSAAKLFHSSIVFSSEKLELSSRNTILQNIHTSIQDTESLDSSVTEAKRPIFAYATWLAVAASAAVLVMFLFSSPFEANFNLQTDYAEVITQTLPDGSIVSLDAKSTLTSVGNWSGSNDRILKLTNDAFFSVTNTPKIGGAAFIVLTESADIEVLGTEFYVENDGSSLRVLVKEGSVRVSPNANSSFEALILKAGDELILNHGEEVKTSSVPLNKIDNELAWIEGKLKFDNTSFIEFKEIVKERYGYNVKLHPALASSDRLIEGIFPSHSVEMLMEGLATAFELQIGYKGDTITIDYIKKD